MDVGGSAGKNAPWLRTPFGDGYRVLAHAYRAQLSPESLRAVLRPQVHKARQIWATSVEKADEESSANLGQTAQKLLRGRLSRVVLWEILAMIFQSLTVLCLGMVFQELELGTGFFSLLGEAANHAAIRCVPFAVLVLVARMFQQFAKHRRLKIAEQASSALDAFLFRRAAHAATGSSAATLAKELRVVPRVVRAAAKCARLRIWAPSLGLCFGLGLLSLALGPFALLLWLMQLILLALEVLVQQRMVPRWSQRIRESREQREAMSAAVLAIEMGCASSTVKHMAWETAVFHRLHALRQREMKGLRRLGRLQALTSALRELSIFLPLAVALLLHWMVSGLSLWVCFQALAASRMTAQQLRRLHQVLMTKIPQVQVTAPEKRQKSSAPKQGDRNSYKSARYAVVIDGMRFFWDDAEDNEPKSTSKPRSSTPMQTVLQRAEKAMGNGLQLVESVSDDASVAERAKRTSTSSNRFDLKVLSLQVKRGSHVGLVGATKSGKSTLLAGLVGGCQSDHWGEDLDGGILLSGRLAYAPQEASLLASCSIRENVLCGRPWDSQRYEQALITSTLSEDLLQLPDGDSSLVEELSTKGLGAMQLARALFAEAQILLLDDPFVQMEQDRQKRALSGLVKKMKDRTILLATQNLSLLSLLDTIVVLRNGTVFEQGDYKTLSSMPTEFSRMLLISNEKEIRRKEHHKDGIPCPFLCYEVGSDPLQELYPFDEHFGTFPSFGKTLKTPKRWVSSEKEQRHPSSPRKELVCKPAPSMDAFRSNDVDDIAVASGSIGDVKKPPRESVSSKSTSQTSMFGDIRDESKEPQNSDGHGRKLGLSLPEVQEDGEGDYEENLQQFMVDVVDGEEGPMIPETRVRRALPSASAVPMVGASEAGGFGAHDPLEREGEMEIARPSSPTSPEVPVDGSIPKPRSSEMAVSDKMRLPETVQWTPGDDDATPLAAPSSPDSADGLRRRVNANDLEVKPPSPLVRQEAQHAAPAPQTLGKPREEDRVKRRRGDKEEPRSRMDVLEKTLKEKNDKIAELEKQMAMKAGHHEKKELLRSSSSSSFLEGRFSAGNALNFSGLRQKGQGYSVLLLGRGVTSWCLVLLVLLGTGIHLAVPVLISYLFVPTWRMSTTSQSPSPSPNVATSALAPTTSNALTSSAAPNVPTFPGDVIIDDSEVLWRGFSSTSGVTTSSSSTTTSTTAEVSATTVPIVISEAWTQKLSGHFCHEPNLAQETKPEGLYDLDPTVGWHWVQHLSLTECKKACEDLISWGCRYISWGGPVGSSRWCYVHQQCPDVMRVNIYQILEMNHGQDGGRRLLSRLASHNGSSTTSPAGHLSSSQPEGLLLPRRMQWTAKEDDLSEWFSSNTLEAILGGLCILLPLLAVSQARLAADVGLQASEEYFMRHLRSTLAAPCRDFGKGESMSVSEGTLFEEGPPSLAARHSKPCYLKDVVDADEFLPKSLVPALGASSQVLAAVICAAAASGRQAIQAVTLTLAVALSVYLHRMRLPVLHQMRRFVVATENAAALRLKHLSECHEVLRVHGRISTLCDDYEALCHDREMASIAVDAAERWLYTRLHCLISLLLGLFSFSLLSEAPTALPSKLGLAVSISAVAQVALVPDAVIDLLKYSGRLTFGLASLRRIRNVVKETELEELESPILKLKPGVEVEKEIRGMDKLKGRSGKIALGDVMVDSDPHEELIKTKEEQLFSVAGYPVDKVPADWPYFGAVDFEDVTVRYSTNLSPAISECSLRLEAGKALLVVGPASCGKTTLLRALLRLVPSETGRVLLDGIDTRSVGLSTIRGRIAVVPQEVVLYRGTWKQNLDPMNEFTEDDLQMVVRLTRFENWLTRYTSKGLEQEITEAEMTLGAAAVLLGLSRAMLRLLQKRSKLLLLDATTCCLSPSSDADLTALLLRYARRCGAAVMQVSRRVQQAPLYDEVAVMAMGRVTEQGPAKKLWVKDGGLRRMAKEQGLDSGKMTKVETQSIRLSSVWGWEVSPQETPAWQDEFNVAMKKVKS